jgi:glycogen debranching enzyme
MRLGEDIIRLHFDDQIVVCERDLDMSRTKGHGYVVADTRLASGYRLRLAGVPQLLLHAAATDSHAARFEFTNPDLDSPGGSIPPGTVHTRVDRSLGHGMHDDYEVTNFWSDPIDVVLEISIESDFADLFDMKDARLVRRGSIQTTWDVASKTLTSQYEHDEFERALHLVVDKNDSPPEYANGGISFRVVLQPGATWHSCLLWIPVVEGELPSHPARECHDLLGIDSVADAARREWVDRTTRFATGDGTVNAAVLQAVDDLAGLRLHVFNQLAETANADAPKPTDATMDVDVWVPAAGVPWFVTLFGRDSLVVSLQTLALSEHFAAGALRSLGALQATAYDPERDMEPGKIIHEIRRGELARLHLIPHTPYYGTHDATTLFVWTAAESWRWHGSRAHTDQIRHAVDSALAWIDRDGDRDGDGLQEYGTRATHGGYFNQGWKDSGEAIRHADGSLPKLPIALCELQGYVVAAKRAWADVLEAAYHEHLAAQRLRDDAQRLADLIEERFWWPEEHTYYLGLDGDKRPIESVASNPGHLLWAEAITPERAADVAARLLAPDMWSGWGVRTLSTAHVSYNPMSYQLGSVWPHDNACIVAGFCRYGLDEQAAQIIAGMTDATTYFSQHQPPELFAGFARRDGGFPVPYVDANSPQAWAAGAVVQVITAILGLVPNAMAHTLTLRPALPAGWEYVSVQNLHVGDAVVDFTVHAVDGRPALDVERIEGQLDITLR